MFHGATRTDVDHGASGDLESYKYRLSSYSAALDGSGRYATLGLLKADVNRRARKLEDDRE